MTEQDRAPFGMAMMALGETFNEPVSDVRIEAYFDALRDLPTDAVLPAMRLAIHRCRFFPRPIEVREMADGSDEDRAEQAWNDMRRIVRRVGYIGVDGRGTPPAFPDEAMQRAALELFGGWSSLCAKLPSEGPELLGYRKQFIASYTAYVRSAVRDRVALPPSKEEARKVLGNVKAQLQARGLPAGKL